MNVAAYYIGIPVTITEDHGDGWVSCLWESGKTYRHWGDQCKADSFGTRPALNEKED